MYQHTVTLQGRKWAVTAPNQFPDEVGNIFEAIANPGGSLFQALNQHPDGDSFWLHSASLEGDFCMTCDLSRVDSARMGNVCCYRPMFLPVDDEGNYDKTALADIEDGDLIPFCVMSLDKADGTAALVPQTNMRRGKYIRDAKLSFHDIHVDTNPKYIIEVVKWAGAFIATRNVISGISYQALFKMGCIQHDVKRGPRQIAWIDGEPWEIRLPAAFAPVTANEGSEDYALILCDRLLELLRKAQSSINPPYDFSIITCTAGRGSGRIHIYHVSSNSGFAEDYVSARKNLAFLPEFVPLDPITLEEDTHYFDDTPTYDVANDGDILSLGSLYRNGTVVSFAPSMLGFPYSPKDRFEIRDTSLNDECRIPVIRFKNHCFATKPILSEISFLDLDALGFVRD